MTSTNDRSHPSLPSSDDIVAQLQERGREKAAERVTYLLSLDGDDPDEQPINIASLREFAD